MFAPNSSFCFSLKLKSRAIFRPTGHSMAVGTKPSVRVGYAKRIVVARGFGVVVPLARVIRAGPKRGSAADRRSTMGPVQNVRAAVILPETTSLAGACHTHPRARLPLIQIELPMLPPLRLLLSLFPRVS